MRIGFSGTGGTGKSTTLDLLKHDMKTEMGLDVLPSVARAVYKEYGAVETDQDRWTPEHKMSLQLHILKARREAEERMINFVSDRTMIDHLSYCIFRNYDSLGDDLLETLKNEVWENMKLYDFVFYFPIHFIPKPDGLRQAGESYRYSIDALIRALLQDLQVNYLTVPLGAPDERALYIREHIGF